MAEISEDVIILDMKAQWKKYFMLYVYINVFYISYNNLIVQIQFAHDIWLCILVTLVKVKIAVSLKLI